MVLGELRSTFWSCGAEIEDAHRNAKSQHIGEVDTMSSGLRRALHFCMMMQRNEQTTDGPGFFNHWRNLVENLGCGVSRGDERGNTNGSLIEVRFRALNAIKKQIHLNKLGKGATR